jgi:steroid 5-alpha reductase family enzyme
MSDLTVLFAGLGAGIALMTLTWAVSYVRHDTSLVDRVWGVAFLVQVAVWAALGDGLTARRVLLVVLVAVWSLRLSGYITWRNWGDGEDKRYVAMRERNDNFAVTSLWRVFWLQGVLAFVIGHTLYFPTVQSGSEGLNVLDWLGVAVWAVGLFFEAVGDQQLARFLGDPDNRGKVMDRGLWRYTRHPNYFGDCVVWAGFALVAIASGAWWGFYGAVLMWFFIVNVSGLKLTEKNMGEGGGGSSREGYDEYVRRTNAFFPGPPDPA